MTPTEEQLGQAISDAYRNAPDAERIVVTMHVITDLPGAPRVTYEAHVSGRRVDGSAFNKPTIHDALSAAVADFKGKNQ